MSERLTEAGKRVLERLAAGDRFRYRLNFMFCPDERSKYVNVWESDKSTVSEATINALVRKGFFRAGGITEAGRAALHATAKAPPAAHPATSSPDETR